MTDTFLLCRACGVLHPTGQPFGWRAGDDEVDADLAAFCDAHAPHGLESAVRPGDRALVDLPLWDPMTTRWFHVVAGGDRLAVRSWRQTVDEPRRFALADADPPPVTTFVEVDEPLLRRALDRHFYPHVIRPAQVEAFVQSLRAVLTPLPPDAIVISFDDPSLPDAGIGPLPAPVVAALIERCAALFSGLELERAASFVRDHSREDGALAVRVRRTLASRAA